MLVAEEYKTQFSRNPEENGGNMYEKYECLSAPGCQRQMDEDCVESDVEAQVIPEPQIGVTVEPSTQCINGLRDTSASVILAVGQAHLFEGDRTLPTLVFMTHYS